MSAVYVPSLLPHDNSFSLFFGFSHGPIGWMTVKADINHATAVFVISTSVPIDAYFFIIR